MPETAGSPDEHSLSPVQLLEAGYTLLTPTHRLARSIKALWDQVQKDRGLTSWQPASCSALDQWMQAQWQHGVVNGSLKPRRLLGVLEQTELWRQVIAEDCEQHADYSLLRVDAAATKALQARENLLRAGLSLTDNAAARAEFRFDADSATFLRWLDRFEALLAEHEAATLADCLTELLAGSGAPRKEPLLALLDFDDIAPLHRAVVERCADAVLEVASGSESARVEAHSYGERRAELNAIARWAAAAYERDSSCRLGIILTDMEIDRSELEYQLRRSFNCLGDNYTALPVNFSTGITLDRAPVVRDALRMLSVARPQMAMSDVLGLLQTRFSAFSGPCSHALVKLLQRLYEDGTVHVANGRLRQLAASVVVGDETGVAMSQCLSAVSQMRLHATRRLPSDWVPLFCDVLECFDWPGNESLDSLEYQQVETWYDTLETFAGQDAFTGAIDYVAALSLLRRCCQSCISQPQTADGGIQVLGPLEGAGLAFDQVWLCGLQGSRWPAPARPNPFIPMPLQREYDMPHSSAEREWQYAAGLMQRYRASCQKLILSYSRQVDGVSELPSPLLQALDISQHEGQMTPDARWLEAQSSGLLERVADDLAPALSEGAAASISGGSGILQAQAACPFRAFASKRLRAEPLDDFRVGLSAAERGSILHDALYALWGQLEDSQQLAQTDRIERLRTVELAVQAALESCPGGIRQRVGQHCMELEGRRLQSVLLEWLELEQRRGEFKVVAREKPLSFTLGGLTMNLRVDRVDEVAEGSRLVIDYKSGRSTLSSWLGARPAQPQLPLYGLAENVDGIAFAQVRARDTRLIGIGNIDGQPGIENDIGKAVKRYSPEESWQGLVAEWRRNLKQLAADFVAGNAAVDPMPGACNYCGLEPLCRVELAGGET